MRSERPSFFEDPLWISAHEILGSWSFSSIDGSMPQLEGREETKLKEVLLDIHKVLPRICDTVERKSSASRPVLERNAARSELVRDWALPYHSLSRAAYHD